MCARARACDSARAPRAPRALRASAFTYLICFIRFVNYMRDGRTLSTWRFLPRRRYRERAKLSRRAGELTNERTNKRAFEVSESLCSNMATEAPHTRSHEASPPRVSLDTSLFSVVRRRPSSPLVAPRRPSSCVISLKTKAGMRASCRATEICDIRIYNRVK